jgi:polysaccharide export outer membrane protein
MMDEIAGRQSLDRLGPGDVLQISIFEVGVSLFGGNGSLASGANGQYAPNNGAHEAKFANLVVDEQGAIFLPFIGRIIASGKSVQALQQRIEGNLRGKSENPHVLVSVLDSVRNSIFVTGSIRKPGRVRLSPAHAHLLDILAEVGGSEEQPYNVIVRLTRGGQAREARLSDIFANENKNLEMLPGDRLEFMRSTLAFVALGGVNKSAQISFDSAQLTVAEALDAYRA